MFAPLLAAAAPDPMAHVLPHYVFDSTWFTNHHVMSLAVVVIGVGLATALVRRMPAGGASAEHHVTRGPLVQCFETICVFLRDEMTRPLMGDLTDKYIKYIWSTFFFILLGNLLGIIPLGSLLGLVGLSGLVHAWGTMTANINFTAGLAVISLFMMIFVGIRENGKGFFAHLWPVPLSAPQGVAGPMLVLILPVLWIVGLGVCLLEILGLVIKAFALCVRLFANIVAGHLVLASLVVMAITAGFLGKSASILGAAAFMFLELFVAFLHAYIFTFLTVIFVSLGAVHHDEAHPEEHNDHNAGLDEGAMPGEALEEDLTGTHGAPA